MAQHMGVSKGQIYMAADGGSYGHVVIDDPDKVDDVLVHPFNENGWCGEPRKIDCFKLACVRYYLVCSPKAL